MEARGTGPQVPPEVGMLLETAITRFKKRLEIAMVCIGLAGLIVFAVSFLPAVSHSLSRTGRGASPPDLLEYGGAFFFLVSILALALITRTARKRYRVLSAPAESPEESVWTYQEEVSIEGFRPNVIRTHLHLIGGTRAWFRTKRAGAKKLPGFLDERLSSVSPGISCLHMLLSSKFLP